MKDPILELDSEKMKEILAWLRTNYEAISRACQKEGLPKPPNW